MKDYSTSESYTRTIILFIAFYLMGTIISTAQSIPIGYTISNTQEVVSTIETTELRKEILFNYEDNYKPSQGQIFLDPSQGELFEWHGPHQSAYYVGYLSDKHEDVFAFTRVVLQAADTDYSIRTEFVLVFDHDAGHIEYKLFYEENLIGYFQEVDDNWFVLEYIDYSHLTDIERVDYLDRI